MGVGGSKSSSSSSANDALSNTVELQLIENQLSELFKFKILLLGAGESGKSTVVKQLKLIHKKKITPKELSLIGTSLHQNIVDCMKALLSASRTFGYYDLDSHPMLKETEDALMTHDENERLVASAAEKILQLFHHPSIQQTYARRNEYWLLDSFPYFINNITRFCEEEFEPTEEDSVMARIRTTGIVVSELDQKIVQEVKGEPEMINFQIVDVGGQRNERKKWLHCFSDVKAILFIVNLAGYNQVLFEDSAKNRMIEELELFEKVTHNELFVNTPIFLFLNKKDLFEQMITEVDMKTTFPDYEGGRNLQPALEYIENSFKKQLPPGKTVQVQLVSARWKRDIKAAFEEVKKTLYDSNRKQLLEKSVVIRSQEKTVKQKQEGGGGGGCCSG